MMNKYQCRAANNCLAKDSCKHGMPHDHIDGICLGSCRLPCSVLDGIVLETSCKPVENHTNSHKQSNGKPQWHLLQYPAIEQIVKVREFGVAKYGTEDGWHTVPCQQYLDAAMRHLTAMMRGETTDSESGLSHAAHLGCNAMFLMELKQ